MNDGLFAGVDRAVFIVGFANKLRGAGISIPLSALNRAAASLEAVRVLTREDLYWSCRVSLISQRSDLATFDGVFDSVFASEELFLGNAQRNAGAASSNGDTNHRVRAQPNTPDAVSSGGGLPWASLPSVADGEVEQGDEHDDVAIPELAPSAEDSLVDRSFDDLDDDELAKVIVQLEAAMQVWPERPSRRRRLASSGDKVAMRSTLRHAMRTGGEPLRVIETKRRSRQRRVVVLVDVSGSMESFARAYLHVTRALVLAGRAEVFAFATELTRITTALRHRSPSEAIEAASEVVGDRFGGTKLASSLGGLLTHPRWGGLVRGAVVVIVSDGWDSEAPELTDRSMARLSRRAHRVVWINPRAAAEDFEPKVGAMAAALPYCDHFLPGHSRRAIGDVLRAITGEHHRMA